jgi:APA family basic amino acid/polyamine antiporter
MQGLFEFLLLLATSATLWFYLAVALAALRLRVARVPAALGMLYAVWTLWGAGWQASALSLVLMAGGLPVWWWTRRSAAGA